MQTRRDGERAWVWCWTLLATTAVACAGRSVRDIRDDSGGAGGSGGSGAATTGGKGGSGAKAGSGGSGGTHAAGAGTGATGVKAGAGGVGGDGGGSGPFPTSGVGGVSGGAGRRGAGGTSSKAGGGGEAGVSGDAGGPPGNAYPCTDPRAWSSNASICADGFIHRSQANACALPVRDGEIGAAGTDDGGFGGTANVPVRTCYEDADCGSTQYCVSENTEACPSNGHTCLDPCESDADCDAQSLCLCQTFVKATGATVSLGTCVSAACRVDSDCGQDYLCLANPAAIASCGRPSPFACQSSRDTCGAQNDCASNLQCVYQDGAYVCTF